MLEETVEKSFNSKEIKPVNPHEDQTWIFIGRIGAEAEVPTLWPPDAKRQFTGKEPHTGKDWGQETKGMREDEMVGWHRWLDGCEFERTPGDSEGQGNLACCSPLGHRESDTTWQLKNNNKASPALRQLSLLNLDFKGLTEKGTEVRAQGLSKMRV